MLKHEKWIFSTEERETFQNIGRCVPLILHLLAGLNPNLVERPKVAEQMEILIDCMKI